MQYIFLLPLQKMKYNFEVKANCLNFYHQGMNWEPWKGHLMSLDFSEIKIRPVGTLNRKKRSPRRREAV